MSIFPLQQAASTEPEGFAYFDTTGELLAQLFMFADGSVIDRVEQQIDRPNSFRIRVRGPGLPRHCEGAVIEKISPLYECRILDAGETADRQWREYRMSSLGVWR